MNIQLQRRHFAALAAKLFNEGASLDKINEVANELRGTNANFNRSRFIEAALGRPTGRDVAALNRRDFSALRRFEKAVA
jgi:hypothetical protein